MQPRPLALMATSFQRPTSCPLDSAFANFFVSIARSGVVDPRPLITALDPKHSFPIGMQHDAHEFFLQLVNSVQDAKFRQFTSFTSEGSSLRCKNRTNRKHP